MLEAKITIEAPALSQAISDLAQAIRDSRAALPQTHANAVPMTQPQQAAANVVPMAQQAPVPTAPQQPAPAAAVPLAQPPQYTVDQIMAAGAQLMDAGKVNDLINLLHSFGVQAVMDLKPDQLGAFATALREMGAKI